MGQDNLSTAKSQIERKYRDHETVQRCHIQGVGFEVLNFEYSGVIEPEEIAF